MNWKSSKLVQTPAIEFAGWNQVNAMTPVSYNSFRFFGSVISTSVAGSDGHNPQVSHPSLEGVWLRRAWGGSLVGFALAWQSSSGSSVVWVWSPFCCRWLDPLSIDLVLGEKVLDPRELILELLVIDDWKRSANHNIYIYIYIYIHIYIFTVGFQLDDEPNLSSQEMVV